MKKLMVSSCPNSAADISPVKMVATVLEYFFKMVSANCRTAHYEYVRHPAWFTIRTTRTKQFLCSPAKAERDDVHPRGLEARDGSAFFPGNVQSASRTDAAQPRSLQVLVGASSVLLLSGGR